MEAVTAARTLTMVVVLLLLVPVGAAAAPPAPDGRSAAGGPPAPDRQPASPDPLVAVLANVGNVSPHCAEQAFSLCLLPVEQRVAAGLAEIDPDVVALIEVLPPHLCDGLLPRNPFNSCSLGEQDPPQALRLLAHDDYDVVCGQRNEWDCLAVRSSLGSIEGCPGGYCGAVAASLPAPEGCDDGFESFLAEVQLDGHVLHVGVSHPNSTDTGCRTQELTDLFEAVEAAGETLLLADANLDPYRESDASTEVWDRHVGAERTLSLISGIAEHDPPHITLRPMETAQLDATGQLPVNVELDEADPFARTIDHALVTDGLDGRCTTLGEAPGTDRLEGERGGLDHRALECEVHLGAEAATGAPPHGPPSRDRGA
jgi:hypothetical protein